MFTEDTKADPGAARVRPRPRNLVTLEGSLSADGAAAAALPPSPSASASSGVSPTGEYSFLQWFTGLLFLVAYRVVDLVFGICGLLVAAVIETPVGLTVRAALDIAKAWIHWILSLASSGRKTVYRLLGLPLVLMRGLLS